MSRFQEAIRVQEWNCAVSALKVSIFQVLLLTRLEIRQWIQLAGAIPPLLRKPDLISPEYAGAEQVCVMRVEYQLRAFGVLLCIAKLPDDFHGEKRMKTVFELVYANQASAPNGSNHWI